MNPVLSEESLCAVAWKLVRPDLTSLFVDRAYAVQYREGEFVEAPEETGLLCFDTLENAAKFAFNELWHLQVGGKVENSLVYLCEASGKLQLPPCKGLLIHPWPVWRKENSPRATPSAALAMPWPDGTVAYRRVRLLKPVMTGFDLVVLRKKGVLS